MISENNEMNDLPELDKEAIHRLEEWGGQTLAKKMIEIFLSSTSARLDQIRGGLSENAPEEAERGAHSLKSSAGNVGAVRLQHLAEKAESVAEDKDMEELQALLVLMEASYEKACVALRNLLEGMEE